MPRIFLRCLLLKVLTVFSSFLLVNSTGISGSGKLTFIELHLQSVDFAESMRDAPCVMSCA